MTTKSPGLKRFDHVGVIVDDLPLVTEFFEDLGFECGSPTKYEGEWIDRINGLEGVQLEMVSASVPGGGGTWFELTKFHHPADATGTQQPESNRPGFRHIACVVDDIEAVLGRLRAKGFSPIGEVVDYENVFRLCFVGGPEGLIVEVAQELRT
jgi:catechol 2,3-dioxygenase-like lactoylglutathione lyase family enzyme